MSAIVIIPARYDSSRFPGKPLVSINKKPMIQHVYERAKASKSVSDVFVATDSRLIFDAVTDFGGKAVMTSVAHQSGTDRLAEAARIIDQKNGGFDVIVNVQGDEPMIHPDMIDDVVEIMVDQRADIGTLVKKIDNPKDIFDPNVVKAVFDDRGYALYFSRAPVPYYREIFGSLKLEFIKPLEPGVTEDAGFFMHKHIGIYAYRPETLKKFAELAPSRLERIEKLEQLRALENGMSIKVRVTTIETIGVDTPGDLERVEKCLNSYL